MLILHCEAVLCQYPVFSNNSGQVEIVLTVLCKWQDSGSVTRVKKKEMSLDSDEGFFSQDASLFMLYKIKVD